MTSVLPALPATRIPQQRSLVTPIPGPQSQILTQRRQSAISSAVGSAMPVWARDADGGVIVDIDGNSFIDLASGIAVTTVGASNQEVVSAAQQALQHFTHTCFMVTPYESYLAVSERLNSLVPGDFPKKTMLVNSGAEAVENAIKIARHATKRKIIVVLDHAYHGRTNLTMALTSKANPYKKGFGPFPTGIYRIPSSYPLRDGCDGAQAAKKAILEIERQIGHGEVAAIIVEPIQGEGGFIVPADGYLPALQEWVHNDGGLLISDEIQTGLARTGAWFASETLGITPDLVTIAKGIADGLPLAAVTGRAECMDSVHRGGLGGTYGGNPVSCSAAIATLDFMEHYDLPTRAQEYEKIIRSILDPLTVLPAVAEVRGKGAMIAIEIVVPGTMDPDPHTVSTIASECIHEGVVVLTAGSYSNVIRLLPPLVMGEDLLREGLEVLAGKIRMHCSK